MKLVPCIITELPAMEKDSINRIHPPLLLICMEKHLVAQEEEEERRTKYYGSVV